MNKSANQTAKSIISRVTNTTASLNRFKQSITRVIGLTKQVSSENLEKEVAQFYSNIIVPVQMKNKSVTDTLKRRGSETWD